MPPKNIEKYTLSGIPQNVKQFIRILYMSGALAFFLRPKLSIK